GISGLGGESDGVAAIPGKPVRCRNAGRGCAVAEAPAVGRGVGGRATVEAASTARARLGEAGGRRRRRIVYDDCLHLRAVSIYVDNVQSDVVRISEIVSVRTSSPAVMCRAVAEVPVVRGCRRIRAR